MPKIIWLGDVDNPYDTYAADAHCTWGDYTFPLDVPVEVDDPHIIAKARTNRFFRLQEVPEPATGRVDYDTPLDPVIEAQELAPPKRSHKKKVPAP
jgi:hypothetical protein